MTLCESVRERMPEVRHGLSSWTAEEAAHLADCADCRLEWEAVSVAAAMGEVSGLDAERVAGQVLARLAADRSRRWVRPAWGIALAAAATIAVVVWSGHRTTPIRTPLAPRAAASLAPSEAASLELPLAELEGVEADVLEDVLAGFGSSAGESDPLELPGTGDLNASELERLLHTMEG